MQLNIKYFGLIAEITECGEEIIGFSKSSISELLDVLFERYPALKDKDFQVAQNHEIVTGDATITESEIALLPPFSGG